MNSELDLLSKEYNQNFNSITKISHGFFQMSYTLKTEENKKYFLKIVDFKKHLITPKQYFVKLEHLDYLAHSLNFIPQLIRTKRNKPYLVSKNKCYLIQEYIKGKSEEGNVEEILRLLSQLHEHTVKDDKLITESFKGEDTKRRYKLLTDFFKENDWFRNTVGENYLGLVSSRYEKFLSLKSTINKDKLCYVHKDPLSNTIKTSSKIYIIDWDDLSIAHKEADLWTMIGQKQKVDYYESISSKSISKDNCEYYALQNFFLYFEAYIQRYLLNPKESIKKEVIEGIKNGLLEWFESVYREF